MQKSQTDARIIFLTKKFSFAAAHRLLNYKGKSKCKNLHGHTYLLEVSITGKINKKTGMIVDFEILEEVVNTFVLKKLDHQYVNDIIQIPTAENIIKWIWNSLSEGFKKYDIELFMLTLWETPTSCVVYKRLFEKLMN